MRQPHIGSAAIAALLHACIMLAPGSALAAPAESSELVPQEPGASADGRNGARAEFERDLKRTTALPRSAEYAELQRRLSSGWNTWDVNSVITQVRLPDGLAIQLGVVHKARIDHEQFLPAALIARGAWQPDGTNKPPFGVEDVKPGGHAYDGSYTDLTLTWQGHVMRIESAHVGKDLVMLVTPLSNARALTTGGAHDPILPVLSVSVGLLWNSPGTAGWVGDHIEAAGPAGKTAVYLTGEHLPKMNVPVSGPYYAARLDGPVGIGTGAMRSLADIRGALDTERAAYDKSNDRGAARQSETAEALQALIAWNVIFDPQARRVLAPLSRSWAPDFGGVVMFAWDTFFGSMIAAEGSRDVAYAMTMEMLNGIRSDGMVPGLWGADGRTSGASQPPVGAMAVWRLYQKYHDRWWLRDTFGPLLAWNRWRAENRDVRGYLVLAGESGLDNSPLDEPPVVRENGVIMLADVALMSEYVTDCKILALIADELARPAEAAELRRRQAKYSASLQTLWDEKTGIFRNRDLHTGELSARLAPNNFYPMMAGVATPRQAERMVRDHLLNPQEFWGEFVLPATPRNEAPFADQDYWRGRIWGPMNFMVYLGLRNSGQRVAQKLLAEKSYQLFIRDWRARRRAYENYNAITGKGDYDLPHGAFSSDPLYNWSGLLPLTEMLELTEPTSSFP